ncbi:flagellar protein FlaG [Candidatus Contubernalis alkaliaceticus]|uniref:flagellar protein FlaG n=1 Tax=Candidatus Contubernalis alkaliaceticus TaxID=338645 RepID=UPI001F4BE059|nr:flagellar protein FlaG [Candidatus Contubernalis alkalaceticus]UNC91726.1 flagellar protein FlaG [Candidatus Contubernalis alkalaceticus]
MIKIPDDNTNTNTYIKKHHDLLKGEVRKVAPKLTNNVDDVNFKEHKKNHRVSFKHNKELGRNVAHIVDNLSGETVKKVPSDAEVDRIIRTERLKGIYLNKKA